VALVVRWILSLVVATVAVAAVLLSLADGFALRLLGEPGTDHGPALRAATQAARTLLSESN